MSGHTPGPWDTNIVGRHIYIEASLRPYVYQEVAACGPTEHVDQQEANARLIAAAPTMHEYITKRADAGDSEAKQILESINAGR